MSSHSLVDKILAFGDPALRAKMQVEDLNLAGGPQHFLMKSIDHSVSYLFQVSHEGFRWICQPHDQVDKHHAPELSRMLYQSRLVPYINIKEFTFQEGINVFQFKAMVPNQFAAFYKKRRPASADLEERVFRFTTHQVPELKLCVFRTIEDLGGHMDHNNSAHVVPRTKSTKQHGKKKAYDRLEDSDEEMSLRRYR